MLEAFGQTIGEYVLTGTARVVVPVITFGRCRVRPKPDKNLLPPSQPLFRKEEDGTTSLSGGAAMGAGLLIWIVVLCVIAAF